mgnify:FL=1
MTLSTREARILAAFPEYDWIKHMDVRAGARMDTSTCGNLLKSLRARKLIVGDLLARGVGAGSGRSCTVYQLTDLGRAVRQQVVR